MDDRLLYKYIKNEISEQEIRRVLDWLDADKENQRYLNELDYIYNLNVLNQQNISQEKRQPSSLRNAILKWSMGAAAVIAICVGVSSIFIHKITNKNAQQITSIVVPAGQRINVQLADGTDVWLNSGTTLKYPAVFTGKERRVQIDGEALFNVQKNSKQPSFIVQTYACDIQVLGTEFNVEASEAKNQFTVDLLEGSVKVYNKQPSGEIMTMRPNEMITLVDGRLQREEIVDKDKLLWKDGILSINKMSFNEVMMKFEQYYDVKIVIERKSTPVIRSQWTKIRISDGIEHALRALQHTTNFTYKRNSTNNTIIIK